MPRLAIVISAVGSIESLESTLVSVLENRPADCEILVALNQPYADPYALAGEVRFLAPPRRNRFVERIQNALAGTRAPFVHLLSSGCEVRETWADEALSRFGNRQVASVAPLVCEAASGRIIAAGVGYRTRGTRFLVGQGLTECAAELQHAIVGPPGFAAFYRKAAIDFVGGLSTQLGPRQADVDLGLTLRHAGFVTALAHQSRVEASRDIDAGESRGREAFYDERLFWRNLPSENRLATIAAHTSLVAMETLTSLGRLHMITQLAGRIGGGCQRSAYARHRRALAELSRRAVKHKQPLDNIRVDRPHPVPAPSESTSLGVTVR